LLPINIGVSQCLMGENVRYDGASKYSEVICKEFGNQFQLIQICPEVEAGLSVPRPPVELIQLSNSIGVRGRDNQSIDVTEQLTSFCNARVLTLKGLAGFIHTPRSPSCGAGSVTIKSIDGDVVSAHESGVFTQSLIKAFPQLPIVEEPDLLDKLQLNIFKLRVIFYYCIQNARLSQLSCSVSDKAESVISNAGENKASQVKSVNEFLNLLEPNEAEVLLMKIEHRVAEL